MAEPGSWLLRQCEEVESLLAIFCEEGAVRVDEAVLARLRELVDRGGLEASAELPPPLAVSVRLAAGSAAARLALVLPHGYPGEGECPVLWLELDATDAAEDAGLAAASSIVEDEELCEQLQRRAAELAANGEECLLPLVQQAEDLARERVDALTAVAGEAEEGGCAEEDEALAFQLFQEELARASAQTCHARGRPQLGRRAMFSHHIIASGKRQAIHEWAAQLRLGVLAKIGWPGVVIVEGDERDVRAYVDALSRLRWKHFVVRGEEVIEGQVGQSLDELRALPRDFFEEFGTDGMSELAARCRQYGLEELFFACLKIGGGAATKRQGREPAAPAAAGRQARHGKHR